MIKWLLNKLLDAQLSLQSCKAAKLHLFKAAAAKLANTGLHVSDNGKVQCPPMGP
jgi:hypothetical protein